MLSLARPDHAVTELPAHPSYDDVLAASLAAEAGELLLTLRAEAGLAGLAGKELGTRGDLESNELLLRASPSARPDDAVLSEESVGLPPPDCPPTGCGSSTRSTAPVSTACPDATDWAVHVALWQRGRAGSPRRGRAAGAGRGLRDRHRPFRGARDAVGKRGRRPGHRGQRQPPAGVRRRRSPPKSARRCDRWARPAPRRWRWCAGTPTPTCTRAASGSGTRPRRWAWRGRPGCTPRASTAPPLRLQQPHPYLPDLLDLPPGTRGTTAGRHRAPRLSAQTSQRAGQSRARSSASVPPSA